MHQPSSAATKFESIDREVRGPEPWHNDRANGHRFGQLANQAAAPAHTQPQAPQPSPATMALSFGQRSTVEDSTIIALTLLLSFTVHHASASSATPVIAQDQQTVCKGDTRGDRRCNHDPTHRVCAEIGKSDTSFWGFTGQHSWCGTVGHCASRNDPASLPVDPASFSPNQFIDGSWCCGLQTEDSTATAYAARRPLRRGASVSGRPLAGSRERGAATTSRSTAPPRTSAVSSPRSNLSLPQLLRWERILTE